MIRLSDALANLNRKKSEDSNGAPPTVDEVRSALADRGLSRVAVEDLADMPLTAGQDVEFLRSLQREFSGLGALVEVMTDSAVTDVVVNPDGSVWVDRGDGMERTTVQLSQAEVHDLAVHLAARCETRLDSAMPFADGVLTDLPAEVPAAALRVHCVLSPPAQDGPCISVRALSKGLGNLQTLAATGMVPDQLENLLRHEVLARKNILISGGTGAGKTSLLTALLAEVPHDQRMIVLEDTPEIIAEHPHTISLTARRANAEGTGQISMGELVRQCLRMRPDRIVVGEIRGAEISDLLVALNTGHAGSAGTLHANSPEAIPGRLEALGAMAGMPPRSLVRQALDGIDTLVHVARTSHGRRITHMSRLVERDGALGIETFWRYGGTP